MADEDKSDESGEDPDPGGAKVAFFCSWSGPMEVFLKVKEWAFAAKCPDASIGAFFQYCFAFAESAVEEKELLEWMLSLVTLYVKENTWAGNWNGASWNQGEGAWDWSQLSLANEWKVSPPEWACQRELEDIARSPGSEVVTKEDVKEVGVKEDVVEKDKSEERCDDGRFDEGRCDEGRCDEGRCDEGRCAEGRCGGERCDKGRFGEGICCGEMCGEGKSCGELCAEGGQSGEKGAKERCVNRKCCGEKCVV